MGCDIHYLSEFDVDYDDTFLNHRSYSVFAFLAGVRNYSAITPISNPRGLPADVVLGEYERWEVHSHSWLSIEELINFDYSKILEDRRSRVGSETLPEGSGVKMTYRGYLGSRFFKDLEYFQENGVTRIVFWFDN